MSVQAMRRRFLPVAAIVISLVSGLLGVPRAEALANNQAAALTLGQAAFGSTVTAGRLSAPAAIATDPVSGAVFVADTTNNRVLRFGSASSLLSGAAAEGVLGQAAFTTSAAAATATGMNAPWDVAMDSGGRLWVADYNNHRVLRFDNAASKPNGASADGVLGQPNFTVRAAATTAAGMNYPVSVAADAGGRLWVADRANSRVLRFDSAAAKANGAVANGVLGQAAFTTATAATTAAGMNYPWGVSVDTGGRLWVADTGNHRVLRFDSAAAKTNGAAASGVLGQAAFTTKVAAITAQGMNGPREVALDEGGRLWVADRGNSRVLRFDSAAAKANGTAANGVLGQPAFTTNTATTGPQGMSQPAGAELDASGRLWVADTGNNRVLRFDNPATLGNGAAATSALGNGSLSSQWPVSADALRSPSGVAVDPTSGKLFVADRDNHRVLRFAPRAALGSGAVAEAVLGQPDFASNAPATTAQGMNTPYSVAVDNNGRLWVVDRGNSRVLRFEGAASKVSGAAADGVLGQPGFTTKNTALTAQGMNLPHGAAVDAAGRLWVVDTSNNRVLRFDSAAGLANGTAASGVLGQPGFTTGAAALTQAGMYLPQGAAVDAGGRLWVADTSNSRVLRFDGAASKANGTAANGVLGQASFTVRTAALTQAGVDLPRGVAVDANGRLWVADTGNNRALWFDGAATKANGAAANGLLGQASFTAEVAAATAQGLSQPFGVGVDSGGRLWVADTNNHRVQVFEDAAPPATALARLGHERGGSRRIVSVPVFSDRPVSGLLGTSLAVRFDSRVLRPHGALARTGSLTPGWLLSANSIITDQLRIALTSPGTPASGTGTLAELEFEVLGNIGSASPLQFVQLALNDGAIPVATQDGSLTVVEARSQIRVRALHATTQTPLSNTTVQLGGASSLACLTPASGTCTLTHMPDGAYTVALTKTDEVASIGAFDASLILQHDAELLALTGDALVAGDVNGNGLVTALDANLVLQYLAGLRALPFPVGKVWSFPPLSYPLLAQDQQATMPGVLLGDVSGHSPPAALALSAGAPREIGGMRLAERGAPDTQGYRIAELQFLPGPEGLLSLEATLRFDPAVVTELEVLPSTLTDAVAVAQAGHDGQLRLALAGARPLSSTTLLTLRYRANGSAGWSLERAEANEGGTVAWQTPDSIGHRTFLPAVAR